METPSTRLIPDALEAGLPEAEKPAVKQAEAHKAKTTVTASAPKPKKETEAPQPEKKPFWRRILHRKPNK